MGRTTIIPLLLGLLISCAFISANDTGHSYAWGAFALSIAVSVLVFVDYILTMWREERKSGMVES